MGFENDLVWREENSNFLFTLGNWDLVFRGFSEKFVDFSRKYGRDGILSLWERILRKMRWNSLGFSKTTPNFDAPHKIEWNFSMSYFDTYRLNSWVYKFVQFQRQL